MDFAMTVRAEHHAFRELGGNLVPAARNAVLADAELLEYRVPVMEVEEHGGTISATTCASAAHEFDGSRLAPPSPRDDGMRPAQGIFGRVAKTMTIRTEEIALLGFDEQTPQGTCERADCEVFQT